MRKTKPNHLTAGSLQRFSPDNWSLTASSSTVNDWRNREHVVLNLFSNWGCVKSKGFFGEPLEHLVTLRCKFWEAELATTSCLLLPSPVCPSKTPPCVRSKRHRVCWHHAHMCFNMWAWCRYTRGRFERTHGGFFQCLTPHTPHTQHNTRHNNTRRQSQRQTEKNRERRQRKKTEKEASDVFVLFIPDLTSACDAELVTSFFFFLNW